MSLLNPSILFMSYSAPVAPVLHTSFIILTFMSVFQRWILIILIAMLESNPLLLY